MAFFSDVRACFCKLESHRKARILSIVESISQRTNKMLVILSTTCLYIEGSRRHSLLKMICALPAIFEGNSSQQSGHHQSLILHGGTLFLLDSIAHLLTCEEKTCRIGTSLTATEARSSTLFPRYVCPL